MLQNRITHYINSHSEMDAKATTQPAFVICPGPVFAMFSPAQQALVAAIYRKAQELTEAQLRKPAVRRTPEFSLN